MAITFQCACGKLMSFDDSRAMERVRCPACMVMLTVPVASPTTGRTVMTRVSSSSSDGGESLVAWPSCGREGASLFTKAIMVATSSTPVPSRGISRDHKPVGIEPRNQVSHRKDSLGVRR